MCTMLPVRHRDLSPVSHPWGPLREIEALHRQLGEHLRAWQRLPEVFDDVFTPLADVEETDDAYVVEIELPGVRKSDVDIELTGAHLTVTGERKARERSGILRRRERVVGRFRYEVALPGEVEEDGVSARLDDGVLTVTVPKAERARRRRIPVQ